MRQQTGRFIARNARGEEVTIHEYTLFADTTTSAGSSRKAVSKEYKTADGRYVNRLEPGKYEIVEAAEVVTSDDPAAR